MSRTFTTIQDVINYLDLLMEEADGTDSKWDIPLLANLVSYWDNGKIRIITPEEGFWEAVEKSALPDDEDD